MFPPTYRWVARRIKQLESSLQIVWRPTESTRRTEPKRHLVDSKGHNKAQTLFFAFSLTNIWIKTVLWFMLTKGLSLCECNTTICVSQKSEIWKKRSEIKMLCCPCDVGFWEFHEQVSKGGHKERDSAAISWWNKVSSLQVSHKCKKFITLVYLLHIIGQIIDNCSFVVFRAKDSLNEYAVDIFHTQLHDVTNILKMRRGGRKDVIDYKIIVQRSPWWEPSVKTSCTFTNSNHN